MKEQPYIPAAFLKRFRETPGVLHWVREFWYCHDLTGLNQKVKGMTRATDELQKLGFFIPGKIDCPMPTVEQVEGFYDGDGRSTVPDAAKAATIRQDH